MKILFYSTTIQDKHLDTYGHVNNATYMELYEDARWAFIEELGYTSETIEKLQKGPIILEANLKYRGELVLNDKILIKSRFTDNRKDKITKVAQTIEKQDGTIANESIFTVGFMDLKLRKLITFPKDWISTFF